MNKTKGLLLTAGIVLAMAFTFSCSGDDGGGGGGDPSSSSGGETQGGDPSSSSNGGQGGGNACTNLEEVPIGTQVWAKKNLDCGEAKGSKCYGDDNANCTKYGRLYDWATAMGFQSSCNTSTCSNQIQSKHKGICPSGWHIPSDDEWTTLTDYVGSPNVTKLMSTSGWNGNVTGTDDFGFSALPGGSGLSVGNVNNVGYLGLWWSATERYASSAYRRSMSYNDNGDVRRSDDDKSNLYSVRCIKD